MRILPSDGSYKTFCDIVTGYRLASVITQAVKSGIVEMVGADGYRESEIIQATGMQAEAGSRFLTLLVNTGILEKYDDTLYLSQFSRRYLHSKSAEQQLAVLDFEQVLIDKWNSLDAVLHEGQGALATGQPDEGYKERLDLYQRAMHGAALVRSKELWDTLPALPEAGVIIDIGAGFGAYLQEFLKRFPAWQAIAADLPDVFAADDTHAENAAITRHGLNLLDPAELEEFIALYRNRASILLLSNVIHCYGREENAAILERLREVVHWDGMVVVHDFITDGNSFGALYDGHMMVNTYNGRTYSLDDTVRMLCDAGFNHTSPLELPSYSYAICASRLPLNTLRTDATLLLRRKALELGFFEAVAIDTAIIPVEPWVKAKCRYGCMFYGRKWSCPPHSMDGDEFKELLCCYSRAILVAGQPPLRDFQERLLELEKVAFLEGCKKALVFSGGPCSWCDACNEQQCVFPEKRRPSLESCGCDVFALAEQCGIPVQPIKKSSDFVQYIGLLLVE